MIHDCDHRPFLADLLNKASLPPGVKAEINLTESQTRSLGWAEGRPNLQNLASSKGLALRVLKKGKQALVTTTKVEAQHFQTLVSKALEIAELSATDEHRHFTSDSSAKREEDIPFDDRDLFGLSSDDATGLFRDLEKKVLAYDKRVKKVVRFRLQENLSNKSLVNTQSLALRTISTSASFLGEVLAEEGEKVEVAWDFSANRFFKKLDFEKLGLSLAQAAVASLGGSSISSGKYSALVEPRVGTQLLGLFAEALSAEAVQLGRSFLRGRLNQTVASSQVTLTDDAFLKEGVASEPFDDEGTPHQKISLVQGGKLTSYFYDLRSASKQGVSPNGFGIKAGLSSVPSPRPTNFFMEPGSSDVQELLGSTKSVFCLKEVMGLHMADPITGEFSLGASGGLYENGKYKHPVRGVTIAGTIGEFMKNIVGVASDLTWYGQFGTPSFLVSPVMIAGA